MDGLQPGFQFQGKWTHDVFRIERLLGEGANGAVYLTSSRHGYAAMKVCRRSADAALEWNVLEQVSRGKSPFPKPILIDDWEMGTATYYFYLMEWIPGQTLDKVFVGLKDSAALRIVEDICNGLDLLHQVGMAYCDIKLQNIMYVTDATAAVRFVDVGGVTPFGRSVRQFTPHSDRAFWDLGNRRAEPSYDICGLSLSLALAPYSAVPGKVYQWSPAERRKWLEKSVTSYPRKWMVSTLRAAFNDSIVDAKALAVQFSNEYFSRHSRTVHSPQPPTPQQIRSRNQQQAAGGQAPSSKSRPSWVKQKMDWTERLMWMSLTLAAVTACALWITFLGWMP